jgi:hypothetical protein
MSYTHRDREPERETRRVAGSMLPAEELPYRQDEHVIRWSRQHKPVPKKIKATVGAK